MESENSIDYSKSRLSHFTFYFVIVYFGLFGYSCNYLNSKDSTESKLQQVRSQASPYNNVNEVLDKMPNEFFNTIDADELVKWIETGFNANPPVHGI